MFKVLDGRNGVLDFCGFNIFHRRLYSKAKSDFNALISFLILKLKLKLHKLVFVPSILQVGAAVVKLSDFQCLTRWETGEWETQNIQYLGFQGSQYFYTQCFFNTFCASDSFQFVVGEIIPSFLPLLPTWEKLFYLFNFLCERDVYKESFRLSIDNIQTFGQHFLLP